MIVCYTFHSRFQEVKQYAHDLESVMKAMLELREVRNTGITIIDHSTIYVYFI